MSLPWAEVLPGRRDFHEERRRVHDGSAVRPNAGEIEINQIVVVVVKDVGVKRKK